MTAARFAPHRALLHEAQVAGAHLEPLSRPARAVKVRRDMVRIGRALLRPPDGEFRVAGEADRIERRGDVRLDLADEPQRIRGAAGSGPAGSPGIMPRSTWACNARANVRRRSRRFDEVRRTC